MKIKRFWPFCIALLGFLPQIALADDPLADLFTPKTQDWSMTFLREIFGRVGTILGGQSQTIMGKIFFEFSAGLLALASGFMIYIIVRGIMDTAHDGQMMGKKLSHWNIIRTVVGLGTLIPKFGSGYGFLQVCVMWAVVQGVGLADKTWATALQYIQNGGVVFSSYNDLYKDKNKDSYEFKPSYISQSRQKSNQNEMSSLDMMRSTICLEGLNYLYSTKAKIGAKQAKQYPQNYTSGPNGTRQQATKQQYIARPFKESIVQNSDGSTTITIPNLSKSTADIQSKYTDPDDKTKSLTGICGVYTSTDSNGTLQRFKGEALKSMFYEEDNLARTFFMHKKEGPLTKKVLGSIQNRMATSIFYNALKYQVTIYEGQLAKESVERQDKDADNMYSNGTNYGWVTAGAYYYNLSKATEFTYKDALGTSYANVGDTTAGATNPISNLIANPNPTQMASPLQPLNHFPPEYIPKSSNQLGVRKEAFSNLKTYVQHFFTVDLGPISALLETAEAAAGTPGVTTNDGTAQGMGGALQQKDKGNEHNDNAFFRQAKAPIFGGSFAASALGFGAGVFMIPILTTTMGAWDGIMRSDKPPIVKIQSVGEMLISESGAIWGTISAITTTLNVANTTVEAGLWAITATNALTGWAPVIDLLNFFRQLHYVIASVINTGFKLLFFSMPLIIAISGYMFTTGAIFAYYVPLIPVMLFAFGVINWLIFVIEAMAAAPLVSLGLTHPEGHDLLGKSEQALMLVVSVFVRPTLMVIGLIAGIILMNISFMVLSALLNIGPIQYDLAKVGIFATALIPITNQSFSTIYLIPEKVMRWIGLSPDHSNAAQMLQQTKEGFGQAAGAASRGAGEHASSSANSIKQNGASSKDMKAGGRWGPKHTRYRPRSNNNSDDLVMDDAINRGDNIDGM